MKRILALDDLEKWHNLIDRYIALDHPGTLVDHAYTAQEALTAFGDQRYDLILSDCNSSREHPGTADFLDDFVAQLKTEPPIIAMSTNPHFRDKAFKVGATDFVDKRDFATEMSAVLLQYLGT